MIFHIQKHIKPSLCIANDISWSQIQLLAEQYENEQILFTNHNALYLPFADRTFDTVICMNTLHHMESRKQLTLLLKSLKRVAKQIIIVEIEDPQHTGGFPRWLNTHYYQGFLGDVGENFLTQKNFKNIIENYFGEASIEIDIFRNIQGNYMIANIQQ